jgi:hypothetical protein
VYHVIPAAKAIRGVSRIGLLLLLPASVGLGLFFNKVFETRRWAFAIPALLLCIAEQMHSAPSFWKVEPRADVAALASRVPPECEAFFYSARNGRKRFFEYQLDAMWAATAVNKPTINGYSSNDPPGWGLLQNNVSDDAEEQKLGEALSDWLRANGVNDRKVCWIKSTMDKYSTR